MRIIIKKQSVFYLLYLLVLSFFIYIADNVKYITICSIMLLPILLILIIGMVKKKHYIYCCMMAFISELLYVIILYKYILRLDETSWRIKYNILANNIITIKMILTSIIVLSIIYLIILNNKSASINLSLDNKINCRALNMYLFYIVYGGIILYYLFQLKDLTMRTYGTTSTSLMLSIFRICLICSIIIMKLSDLNKPFILKLEFVLGIVLAGFLIFISGYRYLIVEIVMTIVFIYLDKLKRIKFKTWIILAIGAIVFYVVITLTKVYILGSDVKSVLFTHERNIFYSLSAIYQNIENNSIYTYWSTIKNLLPKSLTGSTDLNTGGLLMQYIDINAYEQNGITMGGFYLTEAFANFKVFGIYIVSILMGIIISLFELRKQNGNNTVFFEFNYFLLISQMYNIIYYGSSNYIKIIVYFLIFARIITLNNNIRIKR